MVIIIDIVTVIVLVIIALAIRFLESRNKNSVLPSVLFVLAVATNIYVQYLAADTLAGAAAGYQFQNNYDRIIRTEFQGDEPTDEDLKRDIRLRSDVPESTIHENKKQIFQKLLIHSAVVIGVSCLLLIGIKRKED